MTVPAPTTIIEAFASDPTARNAIPVPASATPGAASYDLGFPPATRTAKNAGGVPPFGKDVNGILFEATSNIAWLWGGMAYSWNSDFSVKNNGYAIGAVLRSSVDPWLYWYNRSTGNTNNPDVSSAGWSAFSPLVTQNGTQTLTLSGTVNNQVLAAGISLVNIDTTAGPVTLNGVVPEFDGQQIIVRVTGANNLTLPASAGASSPGNQWKVATDITLISGQTQAFKNYASIPGWVAL